MQICINRMTVLCAITLQVVQDKANWGVLGRLASFKYAFATVLKVRKAQTPAQ
jgi:hypothetical protein